MAEQEKDFKRESKVSEHAGRAKLSGIPKTPRVFQDAQKPQGSQDSFKEGFKHIVRIARVDIPGEKPIRIALKKIKGVGFNLASAACNRAGVAQGKKTGELSDEEVKKLDEIITNPLNKGFPAWFLNRRKNYETGKDEHLLTGTLDFVKDNTIKRLKRIKCYRGIRHGLGLPVRGQRTRSNFRKSKGKVIGVEKRKGVKTGRP